MVTGVWGKKIGMTQVFSENKVVPVTVIDTAHWFVTHVKTALHDGYHAVQVARVRKRYEGKAFSADWTKQMKKYFEHVREIRNSVAVDMAVGSPFQVSTALAVGKKVDARSLTRGMGFQGVVKRHNFTGGPATHGSMFKRRPGTMSFMRTRGRVIKGKKLPGHMGVAQRTMRNLEVVRVEGDANVVLVKGCMPGKSGCLVYLKQVAG